MSTVVAGDGKKLRLHTWPIPTPKAVVAILHGYGEHGGRYAHVAEAWNKRGIQVAAVDLRGHGQSEGRRGHIDRFNDFHLDVSALVDQVRKTAAGAPMFLFGHSVGGLVALDWLLMGGGKDLRGVALSSPFFGVALDAPPVKIMLANVMSSVWPTLALATGLGGKHVSRDPEMVKKYDTDPLMNSKGTVRWFTETIAAADRVRLKIHELQLPIVWLYAGQDLVVKASESDAITPRLTMKDKTVERLEGFYHEILNEPAEDRAKVIDRYATWILAHGA